MAKRTSSSSASQVSQASQSPSTRSLQSTSLSSVSVSSHKSFSWSSIVSSLPSRYDDSSSFYDGSTDHYDSSSLSSRRHANNTKNHKNTRKQLQRFLSRRTECILSTLVFAAVWISCYISMREEFLGSGQIITLKEGQRFEHDFYIFEEEEDAGNNESEDVTNYQEEKILVDIEPDEDDQEDETESVKYGQSLRSARAMYNNKQWKRLKQDVSAAILADPENAQIAQQMLIRKRGSKSIEHDNEGENDKQ
mmetsp:Transcript_21865/g.44805  ORF Transcript_21865/g.44805 Transcript_21865/m.44805 type:complete len:250 (-) Transcript_21865:385-1134(-)|eukprot:CAMPEP_0171378042 /NCGR_PEP_ID=MMETSP0879-20121228/22900_1 /TAXON_ID=67004 /ORGANISM="Thalassiosira weissflogii, Strain CCMP1336" /LENGTH=249 /DNA_ID=CAMNT_0011888343 /DNA_START=17 /DNA_END=766 /DNA_ORIENTATION=+